MYVIFRKRYFTFLVKLSLVGRLCQRSKFAVKPADVVLPVSLSFSKYCTVIIIIKIFCNYSNEIF